MPASVVRLFTVFDAGRTIVFPYRIDGEPRHHLSHLLHSESALFVAKRDDVKVHLNLPSFSKLSCLDLLVSDFSGYSGKSFILRV